MNVNDIELLVPKVGADMPEGRRPDWFPIVFFTIVNSYQCREGFGYQLLEEVILNLTS